MSRPKKESQESLGNHAASDRAAQPSRPREQNRERRERRERESISRTQEEHLGGHEEGGFLLEMKARRPEREAVRTTLQGITAIRELRHGGVSLQENHATYMEKHTRLGTAYLAEVEKPFNGNGHLEFVVDFGGNTLAEWNVGAGHCLPPTVKEIRLYDAEGKVLFERAQRGIKNGRVGYFDIATGAYARIFSGDHIEIVETGDAKTDVTVQTWIKAETTFFENEAKMNVLQKPFRTWLAEKGWKVRVSDAELQDAMLAYLGTNEEPWWKAYKKTGVLDEQSLRTHWEEKFTKAEKQLLDNLALMNVTIDLERLKTLTNTKELAFLKHNRYTDAADIRRDFESLGLAKRLTKNGFLIPEGMEQKEFTDRAFWANLMGDTPETIKTHLVLIQFLGRSYEVNQWVAPYLIEAQERMTAEGIRYEAHSGRGYSYRRTWGREATADTHVHELSRHSWGVAIDINPGQNPVHADDVITDLPPRMIAIMKACGFRWGGDYTTADRDPMHFEFTNNPFMVTHLLQSDPAKKMAQEHGFA